MHDGHALGGCLATVHVFSNDTLIMSDGLDLQPTVWDRGRERMGRGSVW